VKAVDVGDAGSTALIGLNNYAFNVLGDAAAIATDLA
jgi:hypothetical protein